MADALDGTVTGEKGSDSGRILKVRKTRFLTGWIWGYEGSHG